MDLEAKKIALRMISSGLYIITCKHGEEASGATLSWLNQASFTPPMVSMGIRKESHTHALIEKTKKCAIHFLNREQKDIAETFFKPVELDGTTLGGLEFEIKTTGAPILKGLPAYIECEIKNQLDEGDHTIYLAEVIEAEVRENVPSLGMRDTPWHYGG